MPEEILAIVIISIVMGTAVTIVKTVLGYRERTHLARHNPDAVRSGSSGASLTTSELERMMKGAVAEATDDLRDRLDGIEQRFRVLEPASRPEMRISDREESDSAEPLPAKTIGTRQRS